MLTALTFYLFAFILLFSALKVVSSRNPVFSVLYLILAFFNAAALFVLMGAELIAMLLIIVYVGAVAVLFLFVVMMLNVNHERIKHGFVKMLPFGLAVALLLLIELILAVTASGVTISAANPVMPDAATNTHAIGAVLYTDYILLFQLAGLILLVAMIGAIVLTLRHNKEVKRQNITTQVSRDAARAITLTQPKSGKGI